jgi:hypothetical protein
MGSAWLTSGSLSCTAGVLRKAHPPEKRKGGVRFPGCTPSNCNLIARRRCYSYRMTKICRICEVETPEDEFYFCDAERTLRRLECKRCTSAANQKRKHETNASGGRVYGTCGSCGGMTARKETTLCRPCHTAKRRTESCSNPKWSKDKYGYMISRVTDSDGAVRNLSQHREVMAEHLGRPLRSDESVHHKNGIRDDNRIENLELWSRWQPSGQRVADKVAWAVELLHQYSPEHLRLGPEGEATDCNSVEAGFDSQKAL